MSKPFGAKDEGELVLPISEEGLADLIPFRKGDLTDFRHFYGNDTVRN
jgi:hypothetical protein